VAVEADWPDSAAINRYERYSPHQMASTTLFTRFPTWIWRNTDVDALIGFMRDYSITKPSAEKVGLYCLDLYNMTLRSLPCLPTSIASIRRLRKWRAISVRA